MSPSHKIKVEGREIQAASGVVLLRALEKNGIYLDNYCDGQGVCGRCRVKFLSAAPRYYDKETLRLSQSDLKEGVRLCCYHRVESDVEISIPVLPPGDRQKFLDSELSGEDLLE